MKVADTVYQQARKLGLKEVKARTARQEDPYIPALEQMLPHMNAMAEEKLGDLRLDIDQVVGTRSQARQKVVRPGGGPHQGGHLGAHHRRGVSQQVLCGGGPQAGIRAALFRRAYRPGPGDAAAAAPERRAGDPPVL